MGHRATSTFGGDPRVLRLPSRRGPTPRDDYGPVRTWPPPSAAAAPIRKAYFGVAPSCRSHGLKVLTRTAGIASYFIDTSSSRSRTKTALDIDVINLSLGHAPYESAKTDPLVAR